MKPLLIFLLVTGQCYVSLAQDSIEIPYQVYYEYDQEYGIHREKVNDVLGLQFGNDTLKWRSDDALQYDFSVILRETEKYIVALSRDSTHVFYSKGDKRLFYLMKWETTYTAYGVGNGPFGLKEMVAHMMRVIKRGGNAQEVMMFLVRQEDYDF